MRSSFNETNTNEFFDYFCCVLKIQSFQYANIGLTTKITLLSLEFMVLKI